jgi:hypothetical protein
MNEKVLLEKLQACIDDPMWADHAEVPKILLVEAKEALVTAIKAKEEYEDYIAVQDITISEIRKVMYSIENKLRQALADT